MKKLMISLIAALAMVGGVAAPASAKAFHVERADHHVKHVKITYWQQIRPRRYYVELNNGATYVATPCKYEDSRNCFWDAGNFGNRIGYSFLDLRGHAIYERGVRR